MFLRHADLRRICRDPRTFTSATPFRVPIPPEHDIRPTAQLPIESDPPMHSAYRRLMDALLLASGGSSTPRCHPIASRTSLVDAGLAMVASRWSASSLCRCSCTAWPWCSVVRQCEVARWLTWGTQALAAETEPGVRGNTDLNAYIDDAVDARRRRAR